MVPVFTDASSAILLEKTGLFDRMIRHFDIVFSDSVFKELTIDRYPDAAIFNARVNQNEVQVKSVIHTEIHTLFPETAKLGSGEKDTLGLFCEHKNGFILVDDGKAARICNHYHFPFINALLVPKLFWYAGIMKEEDCQTKMKWLCEVGRYSDPIITIAQRLNQRDLSKFLQGLKL